MICGSIVVMVIFMCEDGLVDWECLCGLVNWYVEQGIYGIVVVGIIGEFVILGFEEYDSVVCEIVVVVDKCILVIVGIGVNSIEEVICFICDVKCDGVDVCLLVMLYYNKLFQEGFYQYFLVVVRVVDILQIFYNVFGCIVCDLLLEIVEWFVKVLNIIGIKEVIGNLECVWEICECCGDDFLIYFGDDVIVLELILVGGDGDILVIVNVVLVKMVVMCQVVVDGDVDCVCVLNVELEFFYCDLFLEVNLILVKWVLYEMGLIDSGICLLLVYLLEVVQLCLCEMLCGCGFLEG